HDFELKPESWTQLNWMANKQGSTQDGDSQFIADVMSTDGATAEEAMAAPYGKTSNSLK
ncbi:hypothetical protein NPIL_536131, partial [Nephila pilipes]